MRFFRQEYLSGLPFPTPGDLPHPGIEPMSPVSLALQANSLPTEPLGKPKKVMGSGPYREIKWNLILALNSMDITEKIHIFKIHLSCSVMSDSLWPQGLQHARPPCPSPTPGTCSNSCPFSWWCHPTILSSIVPFSSHLQSFPESGSFPVSQFFASGGQSVGVSASASVLPMHIQD